MKKNLSITTNEERNVTTLELTVNNKVDTVWVEWDTLNVRALDKIQYGVKAIEQEQKRTVEFFQRKLQEEINKLNSIYSIKEKLRVKNQELRKPKNIEVLVNATGETTFITSDVLETLDKEDYTVLTIGNIPVAKNNKTAQLAQYHEVNEEVFM